MAVKTVGSLSRYANRIKQQAVLISVPVPRFQALPLSRARGPFSHSDLDLRGQWDGFRALLYSDGDGVRLLSGNGNVFKSFPELCEGLARDLNGPPLCAGRRDRLP
jgi:hypothetical protein